MASEKDEELLEMYGWELECKSPFEIRHPESGSFATGIAARCVLDAIKNGDFE